MPARRRPRDYQKDFERFKNYVYLLREEALQLVESLPGNDSIVVSTFLREFYGEEKDHYWSLTKLFAHAMYIPMFLQIGMSHFDRLVYIDTHSGPGLARIGPGDDEIVLGSPLIALRWPRIIAENVRQYNKIARGFDRLYFIEVDSHRATVLGKLAKRYDESGRVKVLNSNSNKVLPDIVKRELKGLRLLFYVFIDPYGEIKTQLTARTILLSLGRARADTIISVFDAHIARAFRGKPDPELATKLFGDGICRAQLEASRRLCWEDGPKREDIIKAYKYLLQRAGYENIETIPVQKESVTIYHLMLAVKDRTSPWIPAYKNYLRRVLPRPELLRSIWKNITGRQRTLDSFF